MQLKLVCAALRALAMLPLGGAHAQSYPTKTVRVITPFPAGSGPDSALATPDVRERFASFGSEAWPLSPAQTSAATEADVRRYADTIKRLNLQLD
jgi:tripartite-type tricarboxylate transporter receptor subunit TctC